MVIGGGGFSLFKVRPDDVISGRALTVKILISAMYVFAMFLRAKLLQLPAVVGRPIKNTQADHNDDDAMSELPLTRKHLQFLHV